ncbi:MAG: PQQ-binding-like beta-propeller repeat protein, partial [Verrucomicrobiota bacterium]|nr:PQQ-binding-like beta-propeller repeat protein [Verrucomicrobiota bacterium]
MIAADWPTYRYDGNRSSVSPEPMSGQLNPQWLYASRHQPVSAWPMPGEETPRMHTDRDYPVVVAGRTLFFGNNVDNHVYAIDTRTAEERWRFAADGSIRFAPVVHGGRLFFGSDDGHVYCLDASDGSLVWKYRAGPSGERVIGNSRMISLWPVRTGLLMEGGTLYLAAGIFPYEGLYVAALEAKTGREIWLNDTSGDQAWGHQYGGMAPQGYLVASADNLYVPTGRGMPAAFDKRTGKFKKFLHAGGKVGGAWVQMAGDELYAGNDNQGADTKITFDATSGANRGDQFASFPSIDMVMTEEVAYLATQKGLYAIDRAANAKATADVPKLNKEETAMVKSIAEIRDRHKAAAKAGNADDLAKATTELNQATGRLTAISKEKEVLNAARVKWFMAREQLGPLAVAGELGPMALAGQTLFAGGNGYTVSLDAATGRLISIYGVSGTVMSLAVADERLFVSTSLGEIHCLGVEDALPSIPRRMETANPVALGQAERSIVEEIRRRSGLANGWCLVAGARDGRLALALARETQMNIVVIEHDPGRLEAIRNELYMSVLYGNRVIAADWGYNELPDYFANLIVSERAWLGDDVHLPMDHLARVLRPAGGVLLLGATATWPEGRAGRVIDGLKANAKAAHEVSHADGWLKFTRGKLDGAGSWTGLYGNNSKTSSTADRLVKGPLGVLWFGEPGSEHMVDRHARSVSPLAINGRLFVQGMEVVMAYDAYNGTFLWQRKIPGAVRVRVDVDSSNITANDDSLFVAAHDRVLQLDAQTGKTRREFRVPRAPGGKALRWGNISIDGNTLFGTGAVPLANEYGYLWNALVKNGEWVAEADAPEKARARLKTVKASYPRPDDRAYDYFKRAGLHWYPINTFPDWLPDFKPSAVSDTIMLSEKVFAYDISTGELLWEHAGKSIPNISLVIGGDRVFFLQDDVNETERKEARDSVRASIEGGSYIPEGEQKLAEKDRDVRRVVSLDAKSGKVLWSRPYDLTGSGGTKLGLAYQDNKLLFFGHYSNHDEGPFNKGELSWRRITVLQGESGSLLWSKPLNYRRRPTIVGDTVYIEPRRCDLATGEIQKRTHPITGETVDWEFVRPGHSCGIVTATPHNLFFRSYSGAIVNTEQDSGLQLFGGMRPGCWNSMIPANGLLSMQEASAGCTCNYSLRTTVVLKNKPQKGHAEWAVFISQAATKPVKHLAINFGAPGDMRAKDGSVWFSYPRPNTKEGRNAFANYGIKFKLGEKGKPEVVQSDWVGKTIAGTDKPWLYTSALKGVTRLDVPLLEKEQAGRYTVRLGFAKLPGDTEGSRVFDVKL